MLVSSVENLLTMPNIFDGDCNYEIVIDDQTRKLGFVELKSLDTEVDTIIITDANGNELIIEQSSDVEYKCGCNIDIHYFAETAVGKYEIKVEFLSCHCGYFKFSSFSKIKPNSISEKIVNLSSILEAKQLLETTRQLKNN